MFAHATYDHSEPAADATLPTAPTVVRIWFTEELFRRAGMNSIEVYRADGTRVDGDDATIDDDDRSLMQVSLTPELPDGRYTVQWKTLSADDGHEGSGEFTFTIGAPASTTPAAATAAPATATVVSPTATNTVVSTPPAAGPRGGLSCLSGTALLLPLVGFIWSRRRLLYMSE
ncbi:MAG: copper resistance protein CopC [Caldilineaceae bacterium]